MLKGVLPATFSVVMEEFRVGEAKPCHEVTYDLQCCDGRVQGW
jgi:hypothetical protein